MADLVFKRNDTYPPITVTLSDASGPINLSTASAVHMEMKSPASGTLLASLGCVIASAPGGFIQHNWSAGETAMADTWNLEWEILWAGGGIQTIPNDGVRQLLIEPDLEAG